MAVYGYARVSTRGQQRDGSSLDAQRQQLADAGCTEIVEEAFTGTTTDRPRFDALVSRLKPGDTLVVTKLDRFARSTIEGCTMVRGLIDRGVTVRVLNMGTLDSTPVGKMMVSVMFAMSEFERDMIVQRTQEGIAQRKAEDPSFHVGRKHKVAYDDLKRHHDLVSAREETVAEACRALGIGRKTWYRNIGRLQ